jgi:hypothetical protein
MLHVCPQQAGVRAPPHKTLNTTLSLNVNIVVEGSQ